MNNVKENNIFLKKLTRTLNKTKINKENNIYSSDFETININGKHYVYAIGIFKNLNTYKEFFIKDYNNIIEESNNLIKNYIDFLRNSIKDTTEVYIYFHNLGLFDGYFLVNHFLKNNKWYDCNDLDILTRNTKIYKITYLNITFLDSYNIVPFKLDYIGITLFNKGKTLEIKHYNTIEKIKKNKMYISKYLYNDCEIVYKTVIKFFKIGLSYNTDITKSFTISSIAFNIYRFYYLKEDYEIMRSTFNKFVFIKKGYQGGLNNVLIPYLEKGYNYDVNSLYPYIMKHCYMPLGICKTITKNFKEINEYFGFIECEIYIDNNIEIPPLLLKLNLKENVQFKGYLKGVWFSEELIFAQSIGVVILKIHKVLNFNKKGIIFDDYVSTFYKKKVESNNPIEKIFYKLLLNSLYGRFGMNLDHNFLKKIKDEEKLAYEISYDLKEKIVGENDLYRISNNYYLFNTLEKKINKINDIILRNKVQKLWNEQKRIYASSNIAVQISAAISSYSRIKLCKDMYYHIINNNANIYYYDTDSIFTDKKLDNSFLDDKKIGKYKLVSEIKKGYFIAPKVYSYIDYENNVTIKFKGFKDISKNELVNIELFKKIYDNISSFNKGEMLIRYTLTLLKKQFKTFDILNEDITYEPSFISDKYIKVYENNKWIKNIFPYVKLPILLKIKLVFFNIIRKIITNIIYYLRMIRKIF